jgi:hypothetical protein
MDDATRIALHRKLLDANVDVDAVTRAGGGIWCFGSRAAECATDDSDWDVLLLRSELTAITRQKFVGSGLDVVQVAPSGLDAWATTELAAHVAVYGIRIDDGHVIELRSHPLVAAPRKLAVVAARATHLDRMFLALQPLQQLHSLLRLRRDLHRAWLLLRGTAIPPTAVLDGEWDACTRATRAEVLCLGSLSARISRAISAFGI